MIKLYKNFFKFSKKQNKNWTKSLIFEILKCIFESLQFLAIFLTLKVILTDSSQPLWALIVFSVMLISVIGETLMLKFAHSKEANASYHTCESKRIMLVEKMKYMPMGFFNGNNLGNLTSVSTNTMEDMEAMSFSVIERTLVGVIHAIVMSLCALIFEWRIGLIFLAGTVLFMIINGILLRKSKKVSPQRISAQMNLVDASLEYIRGMGVVKSFHLVDDASSHIEKTITETGKQNLKTERLRIPYIAAENCILGISSAAAALTSISLYLNGNINLIIAILMIITSFMVYVQLEIAGKMFFMLPMIDASIDKIEAVSEYPLMDIDGKEIKPNNFNIEFDNVSFAYDKNEIIKNVSLKIPEKHFTAIVGPSGSGKSTLCKLIARFWDVNKGSVKIGGYDIREYSLDSLLANISMVFQDVYLFNDTIENNIKLGKPDATHQEIVEVAKATCCNEFIEKLSKGYDTVIGEGGATISGGEKQRISIARAMLKNAPIIILDEATANVDPENENLLQTAINVLTKNKTVIMIAHRLKTIQNADQIIVFDDGKIVQKGTHNELLKQDGIYTRYIYGRRKASNWKL